MGLEDFIKEILGGMAEQTQRAERDHHEAPVPGPRAAPDPTDDTTLGRVMRGVVQIVALRQGLMGGMSSAWTGSGTIVDPSGVILTNCHVAEPRAMGMSAPPADRMAIAVTERSDEPPAISYFAEVLATDPDRDLAVMRIVADVRGRPVRNLQLTAVPVGDSDQLRLGDRLSILGYPGIGGETVTLTTGNVSGFAREQGVDAHRAWIKTDATIAGGNSGGTAVDEDGHLVGIPTQASAGQGVTPVDARPVLDTNRDGRIDQRDSPMAVGGFINGLRPVRLAYRLLEQAGVQIGTAPVSRPPRQPIPAPREEPAEQMWSKPEFLDLLFSTRVTDDGRPVNPTSQVPEGVDTVYATFQYRGMKRGTPWSVVWIANNEEIIRQEDEWDDAPQGRKAVKVTNRRGVPPGEYHLVLGIGGSVALEGKVQVGNPIDETDSEVSGRIVDGRTQRAVADATVLVLKPDAPLRTFLRNQDQSLVFTSCQSDSDGRFKLAKQLPKGQAYSLVVIARGYQPVAVDGALRLSSLAPEKADVGAIEMLPALELSGTRY